MKTIHGWTATFYKYGMSHTIVHIFITLVSKLTQVACTYVAKAPLGITQYQIPKEGPRIQPYILLWK